MSNTTTIDRREINEACELLAISYVRGEIELPDYEAQDDAFLDLLFADDDANGRDYAQSLSADLKAAQPVQCIDDSGRSRTTNRKEMK